MTASHILKSFLFIFCVMVSSKLWCQHPQRFIPFSRNAYPSSKFITKMDTAYFGQVQIITVMVHPKKNAIKKFDCRSWLMVKKNHKLVYQKYADIDPVGGCAGLYAPAKQPCNNYYILSKFGSYDGQTLLIDSLGKVTSLTGGSFSISPDQHWLFAIYDSDVAGITIYDLKKKEIIFSQERSDEYRYNELYFQDGQYYASMESGESNKKNLVGIIDLKHKKVTVATKPANFLKPANKLPEYNKVQSLGTCNCGE